MRMVKWLGVAVLAEIVFLYGWWWQTAIVGLVLSVADWLAREPSADKVGIR